MSLEKTCAVVIALGAVALSHCVWSSSMRLAEEQSPKDPGMTDGKEANEASVTSESSVVFVAKVEVPPSTSTDDEASTPRAEGRGPSSSQTSQDEPGEEELKLMAEDLMERTIRLWSAEGFLDLTAEELRRLMPTPDGYDFTGPKTLGELLGGLPTEEECAKALRDAEVRRILCLAANIDEHLADFATYPKQRRTVGHGVCMRILWEHRDGLEDDLMATLDRTTGYPHWSLLMKLYRIWDR